jgi:hypothetical protein
MSDGSERYFDSIVVAAVDVLGMRRLVSRGDACAEAMAALRNFVWNALESRMFYEPDETRLAGRTHQIGMYFGDAVYLFGDPSDSPKLQLMKLTAKVASLIWWGLRGPARFLVRVGIGAGNLRTKTVTVAGISHEIRIGSAMLRAYELEKNQDWVGGAVDGGVAALDSKHEWTVDYPVPLHRECPSAKPGALKWVGPADPRAALEDALRAASANIGSCASGDAKVQNSLRFIEWIYKSESFAPLEMDTSK